jgi:ech hydrogenase subunit D
MTSEQSMETVAVADLIAGVRAMHARSARLVQIGVTALPGQFELTYSFDVDGRLCSLRTQVPASDPRVPSIHSVYGCAFLYENEMHDLFGLIVEGMAVDFHGNLYHTSVKFAFGETKAPVAKPQPVAAPPKN